MYKKTFSLLALLLATMSVVAQEAYTILSDGTLTFYYDSQAESRSGTRYSLPDNSEDFPLWINSNYNADGTSVDAIQRVVFDASFANARPRSTKGWFNRCTRLTEIAGWEYLNTSAVTNMNSMFYYCSSLTVLDLSHFDTSHVTNMAGMFTFCSSLRTIYCSNLWTTDQVSDSQSMFGRCSSLIGGQGTYYREDNPNDKTYAHADGGEADPGYLTPTDDYAVYSNNVLTFYSDTQKSQRQGMVFDIPTSTEAPRWVTNTWHAEAIINVVFDASFAAATPTTTYQWFYNCANLRVIEGIEYLNTEQVTNMDGMFANCSSLTTLDLSHFNTSNVESMANMFANCRALATPDLSKFDTGKVTNMTSMFEGCPQWEVLDLQSFNTASTTLMNNMFKDCTGLQSILVGDGWTTAAVENAASMFEGCTALMGYMGTAYDAEHVDSEYARIDTYDLPGYLSRDANAPYAVYENATQTLTFYCDKNRRQHAANADEIVHSLNKDGKNTTWGFSAMNPTITKVVFDASFSEARPVTTYHWFYFCIELEEIVGLENLNTSAVTSMCGMFYAIPLTQLDLSNFDTRNVENMQDMFAECKKLTTIKVGNYWSTAKMDRSAHMFYHCVAIVGSKGTTYDPSHVDAAYAHVDGGTDNPGYLSDEVMAYAVLDQGVLTLYYDEQRSQRSTATSTTYMVDMSDTYTCAWNKSEVTAIHFDASFKSLTPKEYIGWFSSSSNLTQVTGLENLNTSEVSSMSYMFNRCTSLTSIDLTSLNTSKVTTMGGMFSGCSHLTTAILTDLDVASVTTFEDLFNSCERLETIELSGLNTSEVTSMQRMFYNCKAIKTIDLSSFNTEKVQNMNMMFSGCESLNEVDLSKWNTSNVNNMEGMFTKCRSLEHIDLRTFNTSNVTHIDYIFMDCEQLKSVNMSGLDLQQVANFMTPFYNCPSLMSIDLSKVQLNNNVLRQDFPYSLPSKSLLYLPTGTELSDYGSTTHEAYNVVVDKDGDGNYTCDDFRLSNDIVYDITTPFTAAKASFDRQFTAGQRSTIYLPFAFDATAFGTLYPFSGEMMNGNAGIRFFPLEASASKAHEPYVIDPNGETISAENVAVETSRSTEVTGANQMVGVCKTGYVPMGAYCYDAADGKLKRVARENSVVIRAGRAYFLLPDVGNAAAGALATVFESTSAIGHPATLSSHDNDTWATLGGQLLKGRPATKGIYIHQGRKIVVK